MTERTAANCGELCRHIDLLKIDKKVERVVSDARHGIREIDADNVFLSKNAQLPISVTGISLISSGTTTAVSEPVYWVIITPSPSLVNSYLKSSNEISAALTVSAGRSGSGEFCGIPPDKSVIAAIMLRTCLYDHFILRFPP